MNLLNSILELYLIYCVNFVVVFDKPLGLKDYKKRTMFRKIYNLN